MSLAPALEAIREAADEIKKRARGDERQMARLTKAIETSVSGAESVAARAAALGTIAQVAEADIAALGKQARDNQAIQSSLLELMSQAERLVAGQTTAAQTMQQMVETLTGKLEEVAASWQRASATALDKINEHGSAVQSDVARNVRALQEAQQAALKQTNEILAQTLNAVQQHSRELAKELETSPRYTQQVHGALVEMTGELARRLEPPAPASEAANS
jgi:Mg2+ and Co2+ transporter CorA